MTVPAMTIKITKYTSFQMTQRAGAQARLHFERFVDACYIRIQGDLDMAEMITITEVQCCYLPCSTVTSIVCSQSKSLLGDKISILNLY